LADLSNTRLIPDKSLVGGKVPKCITSTTKDTIIIVYFIPIDKNIAEYKVYVNPARWYAGLKYILQLPSLSTIQIIFLV